MKKLVGIDKDLGGGDVKGSVSANLGIEVSDLVLEASVKARYPLEKVLVPAFKGVDAAIDGLEGMVPGDQKAIAETIKAKIHEEVIKAFSEKPA